MNIVWLISGWACVCLYVCVCVLVRVCACVNIREKSWERLYYTFCFKSSYAIYILLMIKNIKLKYFHSCLTAYLKAYIASLEAKGSNCILPWPVVKPFCLSADDTVTGCDRNVASPCGEIKISGVIDRRYISRKKCA